MKTQKNMKVYMAHPWVSYVEGAAKSTQQTLEANLPNTTIINPFEYGDLTGAWMKNKHSVTISKAIVRKDLELIRESDYVIVYYPSVNGLKNFHGGFGTPMEIFYASHVLMKRVYALTPFVHPWLIGLNVKCYQDIYEMIEEIKREWKL